MLMDKNKIKILNVDIDLVSMDQTIAQIISWVNGKNKHYIVTPNIEFIMAAQHDKEFLSILNNADVAIPDSARLGWASQAQKRGVLGKILILPFVFFPGLLKDNIKPVTGTDLVEEVVKKSGDYGFTVGFIGGKNGVAKRAKDCLLKKYPKAKIIFAGDGPTVEYDGSTQGPAGSSPVVMPKLDILFVGFGQVKQEKWIAKNLNQLPVKVAVGVGGAFDYFSGSVVRAPVLIRSLGFEWLFRLIIQPWRIKRQLNLIKFVWLILTS